MRSILFVFLLLFEAAKLLVQSNSHKKSGFAIIDPVYRTDKQWPVSKLKTVGA